MRRDRLHDFYFQKAKAEGFSARSVYKLQDIQSKYKVLKHGDSVMDLGASPGSWSEWVAEELHRSGSLTALDLNDLSTQAHVKIKNAGIPFEFFQQSLFDPFPASGKVFDVVLSDMAPLTGGNRLVDTQRSLQLIEGAFEFCKIHLKPGGNFVVKLFQSPDTIEATKQWKSSFSMTKLYRPPAVRKESKELYFIGLKISLSSSV